MTEMGVTIIADDLTGAAEVAAAFAGCGAAARVRFHANASGAPLSVAETLGSDAAHKILAIDTETRNAPVEEAHRVMRAVAESARPAQDGLVYKKIDSTLRGPVATELATLIATLGTARTLVVPAFPAHGRTTRNGTQLAHGVPVDRTEAAHDPVHPVTTAHLPTLLQAVTGNMPNVVGVNVVEEGDARLAEYLERAFCGSEILVVDVEEDAHLDILAEAVLQLMPRPLLVGSAGLALALARRLSPSPPVPSAQAEPHPSEAGALVVCGSRHSTSLAQAAAFGERDTVKVHWLQQNWSGTTAQGHGRRIAHDLQQSDVLLMAPAKDVRAAGRSPHEAAETLGEVVADVVAAIAPAGLVLTGGETAIGVLRALGANEIQVFGELADGIPVGAVDLAGGRRIPVVTKAGGFGGLDILGCATDWIHAVSGPATSKEATSKR